MIAVTDDIPQPRQADRPGPTSRTFRAWLRRPLWNRFTPFQLIVMMLAAVAPMVIAGAMAAALLGAISVEAMTGLVLAAGENPGMVTFGAMFLASPIQWFTGRSQVRVRKYLGIVFFLLASSNGAMFVIESGIGAVLGQPFLIAGTIALALAVPLFLTSSRWSQRTMGMKKWRLLHKLTYVVAAGLLAHVILMGEIGPGAVMIAAGFISRIPAVRRWITELGAKRKPHRSPTMHHDERTSQDLAYGHLGVRYAE